MLNNALISEMEETPDFYEEELKLYNEFSPIENEFKNIPDDELTTTEMITLLLNSYFLEKFYHRINRFDEEYAETNKEMIENIKDKLIQRETQKMLQYARNEKEVNEIFKWAVEKFKPEIDKLFEKIQNRTINEAIYLLEESGLLTEGEIKRFGVIKSFIDLEINEFLSEPTFVAKVESIVFEEDSRRERISAVSRTIRNVHVYDVQRYLLALADIIAQNYTKMLNPKTDERIRDDLEKEQLKLIEKLEKVIAKFPKDVFYVKIDEERKFVKTDKYLARYISTKVLNSIKEITKVDIGRPVSQVTFAIKPKELKELTDILEKDEDGEVLYQMFTGQPIYTLEKFLKMQKISLL
jgi:nicotinamide mononucleotide adenylyltransferase